MATIRLSVPKTAAQGDIIEIRALIQHPMETGFRRGPRGEEIPRDIITEFECFYNGVRVFAMKLFPGIAANPFLSFHTRAVETGTLEFIWRDQDGQTWSDTADITVI